MDNAVPRESLNTADKIVVVEAPTEGASPVLVALREMALVLSTDVIDAGLQRYLQSHDLEPGGHTHEPFLVCLTQRANVDRMMASVTSVTEAPSNSAQIGVQATQAQSDLRDGEPQSLEVVEKDGERGRNRTFNLLIKSSFRAHRTWLDGSVSLWKSVILVPRYSGHTCPSKHVPATESATVPHAIPRR